MDRFDREILRRLQDDGRSSFTDIGKAVHLSPNAVAERVRRLSRDGVIRAVREFEVAARLGELIPGGGHAAP